MRIGCSTGTTWLCRIAPQFSPTTSSAGDANTLAVTIVQIVVRTCVTFLDMNISGIAPLKGAATMGARVWFFFGIYLLSMMIADWLDEGSHVSGDALPSVRTGRSTGNKCHTDHSHHSVWSRGNWGQRRRVLALKATSKRTFLSFLALIIIISWLFSVPESRIRDEKMKNL